MNRKPLLHVLSSTLAVGLVGTLAAQSTQPRLGTAAPPLELRASDGTQRSSPKSNGPQVPHPTVVIVDADSARF